MEHLDQLTNLGVAGLMGAMWLWERAASRKREEQLDDAHARIMTDKIMLDQLIDVVQKNTQAMTRLVDDRNDISSNRVSSRAG